MCLNVLTNQNTSSFFLNELTNQNTSSKLFKCVDQSGDYIYCKPYPCIDKAVSLYYYTASWHILTRMNKTIYKHAVSHNISMKCDKKYDSKKKQNWVELCLYIGGS